MKPYRLLFAIVAASFFLVLLIYFIYRSNSWPMGQQALECLVAAIVLLAVAGFLLMLKNYRTTEFAAGSIGPGLWFGLLWAAEISMNNIIHPPVALRDPLDDVFWGIVALLILILA